MAPFDDNKQRTSTVHARTAKHSRAAAGMNTVGRRQVANQPAFTRAAKKAGKRNRAALTELAKW